MNNADTRIWIIHSHNAIKFWLLSERLSELYSRSEILFRVDTHTIELYTYTSLPSSASLPKRAALYYVFIFLYLIQRSYVEINSMSRANYRMLAKITSRSIAEMSHLITLCGKMYELTEL